MKRLPAISLILTFILLSITVIPAFSVEDISSYVEYKSDLNKLHFYFSESTDKNENISLLSVVKPEEKEHRYIDSENELKSAVENMNEYIASDENVDITVEFKSNFSNTEEYIKLNKEKLNLNTISEVRSYRKRLNEFSKKYHQEANQTNIKLLENFDFNDIRAIGYAPFVTISINPNKICIEDLKELAENETVANISLSPREVAESDASETSWDTMLEEIEADDYISEGTYTGEGVRIGVYEADGICDINNVNLIGKSITIDGRNTNISEHATKVASIIALMAPEADFYVSAYHNYLNGSSLEWFIDNECDVINCSFSYYKDSNGNYTNEGYRYHIDGLFDYQIMMNDITVVSSSGNKNTTQNPNSEIYSPGLAYNSITVGGVVREKLILSYYLNHTDGAAYIAQNRIKPEVSALYKFNIPGFGEDGGTSFSAPQVTAAIALLLEKKPNWCASPEIVKSSVIATADETRNFDESYTTSSFDDKVGAGVLNVDKLLNITQGSIMTVYDFVATPNDDFGHITIYLPRNANLQAAAAWNAHVNYQISTHSITNYDLRLYNEDGSILLCESSLDATSNVELFKYKTSKAGYYRLAIYQNGNLPEGIQGDFVGIAYHYTTSLF